MRFFVSRTSVVLAGVLLTIAAGAQVQPGAQGFAGQALMRGGGFTGSVNPMQSHAMELIQPQRTDVRSELHLDIKQKAALDELMNGSQNDLRERMRRQFQSPEFQSLRNLPQAEQRAKMQELLQANRSQMMADMQSWQGELNEKVKAILRPGQVKRLGELDLQYRGPLSLGDPKVAESVQLSPEHRGEIAKIYGDFQSTQQQMMQEAFQKIREAAMADQGGQGGRPNARGRFNPEEMQTRLQPVMRKIEAQRKEAEEKTLALLSPEEKQGWSAVQGEKFAFRKDLNPNGARGNF